MALPAPTFTPPSVLITGVPRSPLQGGTVPVRLEINDFLKHEEYWSLYIQALRMPDPSCCLPYHYLMRT